MDSASWSVLWILILAVGLGGGMAGCAHLLPVGTVVNEDRYLGEPEPPAAEEGEPAVEFPVLPFGVWGLHFDEELVIELTGHPTWRMLEVTRIEIGDEAVWFALDSHRCGRQWVGVEPEFERYARSFPAPTYHTTVDGTRTETDKEIRYEARWTMQTGEEIEISGVARKPLWKLKQRNGNTMNHSQETAMAVIDLERLKPVVAQASIDGVPQRISKLSKMLLIQAAGGVAEGEMVLAPTEDGGVTVALNDGDPLPLLLGKEGGATTLTVDRAIVTECWRFEDHEGSPHLVETTLTQGEREVLRLRFNPPLPDLRRPVTVESTSRMVISVNGLPGYVKGIIEVAPADGGSEIRVIPLAPKFVAIRPARSLIRFPGNGRVSIETLVEPTAPWSFGDVACPE